MDSLHACIALSPLAIYSLLLGTINISKRPFLTTGGRDLAALGVAISGMIIAGPMELFLPERAVIILGPYAWLLPVGLFALCVTFLVLVRRPRLVIYNLDSKQLRPILAEVAFRLDEHVRWAGDGLILPNGGVQLHLEPFGIMRGVQLISSGPQQSYDGWQRLETALAADLRKVTVGFNPGAIRQLGLAGGTLTALAIWLVFGQQNLRHAVEEMLRIGP